MDRHDDVPILNQQPQPQQKKCHGNRRNQRFRRKCRAHKMKPSKMEKLIKKRNRIHKKNQKNNSIRRATNTNIELTIRKNNQPQPITTTTDLNKRKRDISLQELSKTNITISETTSSVSIVQPSSKKMKNLSKTITNPIINANNSDMNRNTNYRRPMYLTRSSHILCQILNKTLNYSLKKKDEQQFIYLQLELLDQQYCLEKDQELWQSYLDIGIQQHIWPDQLYTMAKTNDFDLCKEYLMNYIQNIKKQLNQCQSELAKQQTQTSPILELSFEQIEHRLKELVNRERKYLSKRNNKQLIKFKDDFYEKELFKTISTYFPKTNEQDDYTNELITIRQKQAEIWQEQLMLEMRILCKFLPQNVNHLENFIAPIAYLPLNNNEKIVAVKNKHYKIIQEGKRIWLNYFLNIYEIKLQEYEEQYQNKFNKLESQLLDKSIINGPTMLNTIKEYIEYRINKLKKDIYDKMSSFRRIVLQNRQRSTSTGHTIGVSPEPYLDLISNPFNKRQWNYLSLGPSYIRLNQSAIRPKSQQLTGIKDEHKDIYKKVENHLVEKPHCIPRTKPIFKEYSNHLLDYLNHSYFTPLPYKDQLQTLEQAQIVGSIRQIIKNMDLIIRLTDKGHNFYIGLAIEFEKKVEKFFSDTNAFIELSYNPFNEILDKVIELLNKLYSKKLIWKWQYEEMMPDRTKCELAHLYFNPKTHKDGIPVRPIENTIHASTTKISKLLDKILRPIFDSKCKETTIIDGTSLITELTNNTKKGLLKPTTLFCTFDIRNLYTMLPQEQALNSLMTFLHVHGYRKVKGINLDTIRKLASIVLQENVFAYGKKIYKQTTGGAMGSSFTLTLANIFMWEWQKKIVDEQTVTGEFYGRYIDDIFMTWNKSENELKVLLDEANTWHPNIKLDYKIGKSLPFLDVLLTNNNGILSTSVYHKPATEPYVTPFISDHPRHVFTNIIKTSLTRAIRYSSTFEVFNNERRYIKLMLLYNGYTSTYIEKGFHKHLSEHISTSPFLPLINNQKEFILVRNKLLGLPTPRQSQVAMSAATTDIDNDQTDDQPIGPTEIPKKPETKQTNFGNKLFV
ncbi:unnamed protein product [Rotaria sordida]|uniref:Reverse transcriptase domain-containing protein n=1 Tax=Rotaria sordida TaxID=392033 RepID=A0A819ZHG6_9BILA|nr:unnamed protein product [Rotaria sordida]